jgi:predicted nucleic acid-binding protein
VAELYRQVIIEDMKTIVLDTNIWLSELALMSPIGCAFSHYITVGGYNIGLSEVIEEETKHIFRKNLLSIA